MKDFYKQLGLRDNSCDAGAIERAIQRFSGDAGTKAAAQDILLIPSRRAIYDRDRKVLLVIADLRSKLGLTNTVRLSQIQRSPAGAPASASTERTTSRAPRAAHDAVFTFCESLAVLGLVGSIAALAWLGANHNPTQTPRDPTSATYDQSVDAHPIRTHRIQIR